MLRGDVVRGNLQCFQWKQPKLAHGAKQVMVKVICLTRLVGRTRHFMLPSSAR